MEKLNLDRKALLKIFRKAHKLEKRLINSATNPLGIPENAYSQFYSFLSHLEKTEPYLAEYFDKAAARALEKALSDYHRPRVRGRDGMLYSQSDMDEAMMY